MAWILVNLINMLKQAVLKLKIDYIQLPAAVHFPHIYERWGIGYPGLSIDGDYREAVLLFHFCWPLHNILIQCIVILFMLTINLCISIEKEHCYSNFLWMLTNTIDILRCSTYVIAKALLPPVFTLIFFQLQPNLEFGMLRQTDSFHQIFKAGFVLMVNILR